MNCITQLKNFNIKCNKPNIGGLKRVFLDLSGLNHIYRTKEYEYDTKLEFYEFVKNLVELPYSCYNTGLVSTSVHNNKANYSVTALNITINSFDIYNFNELKNSKPILYYQTNNGDWGVMSKCRVTSSSIQTGTSRNTASQIKLTFTEEDLYIKECSDKLINNIEGYLETLTLPETPTYPILDENDYLTIECLSDGRVSLVPSGYKFDKFHIIFRGEEIKYMPSAGFKVAKGDTIKIISLKGEPSKVYNVLAFTFDYRLTGTLTNSVDNDTIMYLFTNRTIDNNEYYSIFDMSNCKDIDILLLKKSSDIYNSSDVHLGDFNNLANEKIDVNFNTFNLPAWLNNVNAYYCWNDFENAFQNTNSTGHVFIDLSNLYVDDGVNINSMFAGAFKNTKIDTVTIKPLPRKESYSEHYLFINAFENCKNLKTLVLYGNRADYIGTDNWLVGTNIDTVYIQDKEWLNDRSDSGIPLNVKKIIMF